MIFLLTFTVIAQAAGLPRLRKGASYAKVRGAMLKAGWKPYRSPDADECMTGDKRCEGRPEMENCAGTGTAACRFLWKRRGKTVVIFTVGEEIAVYNGHEFQ